MSATQNCNPCCSTETTTQYPGPAGQDSFSFTTASFVVPVIGGTVSVPVISSTAFYNGQNVVLVSGLLNAGNYYIELITGNTLLLQLQNTGSITLGVGATVPANYQVIPVGVPGQSAFTTATNGFVINPVTNTVAVGSTSWMATGMVIIISDNVLTWAHFLVVNILGPQTVVLNPLNYPGDTATIIGPGEIITVSGQSNSLANTIANGLTGSNTKAGAQTSLGLGQSPLVSTNSGLNQAITATPTQVGTVSVTIPSLGTWLYMATVAIDFTGTTFASSRTITAKLRNVSQSVDIASAVKNTRVLTTTSIPTTSIQIPFVVDGTPPAAGDQIQLLISIDVINTAGTLAAISASFVAIPISLA